MRKEDYMIEIKGRFASARVFTDVVDEASITQITLLCNQEFAAGSRIRMMPDVHAGMGCTVGTTMTLSDKAVPNLVGADIGCGIEVVRLREKHIELQKLDRLIYRTIPSGFSVRQTPHRFAAQAELSVLRCARAVNLQRGMLSIGTLGGGNHFIEVDQAEDGTLYLVIHSGSRRLGQEVAQHYQNLAYDQCNGSGEEVVQALIAQLRAEGRQKEIPKAVKALKGTKRTSIPRQLCFVTGGLFLDYLQDMKRMQAFATLNRRAIADELLRGMGLHAEEQFTTIHNYIDTDAMILRKGAVSARAGERLLIPINMRDGSLICTGRGNEEWNQSAPHGAGRLMSRSQARESFTVSEYKKQMEGIYTTSVCRETLDECPMAYKSMADIVGNIGPTVEIESVIRPVYNFKASEAEA